jgi:hypothetical protein
MIHEVIVTTVNEDGSTHIAPMGIHEKQGLVVIAPFKPSATLNNIQRNRSATVNRITDVRVFAGCLTGRKDWPLVDTKIIEGKRLACALSHLELEMQRFEDDELRPEFFLKTVNEENHAPFNGFNRAQAAVLEAAILVSRLHMLPEEKIRKELEYLTIAIEKTAGEEEQTAWDWLMEKIRSFQKENNMELIA